MTSILVSSDDEALARNMASWVADSLDYRHVGFELLDQVAAERDVPTEKLREVLTEASTGWWGRKHRELLLSYIETAVLDELMKDRVVCSDLAAHLYARSVSHLLTARVLADPRARARELAEREKIPVRKAWAKLAREDRRRTAWSIETYGVDEIAASSHDLIIGLSVIDSEKAVETIASMASYRKLTPTTYSQQQLQELAVASRVRSALLPHHPHVRVRAAVDTVTVWVECSRAKRAHVEPAIERLAREVPGVGTVQVCGVSSLRKASEELPPELVGEQWLGADWDVVG